MGPVSGQIEHKANHTLKKIHLILKSLMICYFNFNFCETFGNIL